MRFRACRPGDKRQLRCQRDIGRCLSRPWRYRQGNGAFKGSVAYQVRFSRLPLNCVRPWQCEQDIASGQQLLRRGHVLIRPCRFSGGGTIRSANPEAHYSLGIIFQYKGQLDDAETEFRLALLLKPDSYQTRRHLAYTLADAGQNEEATARVYKPRVKEHPDSFDAHTDMAKIFASAGQRNAAIV